MTLIAFINFGNQNLGGYQSLLKTIGNHQNAAIGKYMYIRLKNHRME
jgi:hypothetical protein